MNKKKGEKGPGTLEVVWRDAIYRGLKKAAAVAGGKCARLKSQKTL
jgi:hypothetical protein